jgi:hypothetical protein
MTKKETKGCCNAFSALYNSLFCRFRAKRIDDCTGNMVKKVILDF